MDQHDYSSMDFKTLNKLQELYVDAANAFLGRDFASAAGCLENQYNIILEQQDLLNKRFHKGWQLHNWGASLQHMGRNAEGAEKILLAYIEDALTAGLGKEDSADLELAGQYLRSELVFEPLLKRIKSTAHRMKERGDVPFRPEEVLARVLPAGAGTPSGPIHMAVLPKEAEKRKLEGVSSPFEKRCFIGGAYRKGGNLTDIKEMVREDGYDPVLVNDFELDERDTHRRSLLLLHMCDKAIFDVTNAGGQLMELERCRDYDIKPLIVHQVLDDQDLEAPLMIVSMVEDGEIRAYSRIESLKEFVHDYLTPKP